MKIGLVIPGSLDMVSGGFLYDRRLKAFLEEQGDTVEVLSLPWGAYGSGLLRNLSAGLLKALREADCDLLLQDELAHPALFLLNSRLRPHAPFRVISIVHHLRCCEARPSWQNSLYRRVEKRYLDSVDGFIFNSRTTKSEVEALISTEKRHVVAFPAASHVGEAPGPREIEARARRQGPVDILFVGNVTPRKQLHVLLDALTRAKGLWRLTVVGSLSVDPSYAASMARRIARSGLASMVSLRGRVSDGELASIMRRSHILAVPSAYEGFGIVYLEAMAFGLPALASSAGGAREIVTHGHNGFLVGPGDAGAIRQHLQALIDDRERLVEMGLNARKTFLERPGWDESLSGAYEFLHNLG